MDIHTEVPYPKKPKSPIVTPAMAAQIKAMIKAGMHQHHIAAHFGINQGRVSEINTGRRFRTIAAAQLEMNLG